MCMQVCGVRVHAFYVCVHVCDVCACVWCVMCVQAHVHAGMRAHSCTFVFTVFWFFVLCFVMGYVLKCRETTQKRIITILIPLKATQQIWIHCIGNFVFHEMQRSDLDRYAIYHTKAHQFRIMQKKDTVFLHIIQVRCNMVFPLPGKDKWEKTNEIKL